MNWEASISTTVVNDKGNDKVLKRSFILENYESFLDVEKKLYEEFGAETGFEVLAIKKSKLREIVNERPAGDEDCKVFFATICDFFTDDNDVTKEIKYTVALFAHDINEAHQAVKQYMSQGLEDMELKQLKETKINDVIR